MVTTCLINNYSSISVTTKGHRRIFGTFRVFIAAHTRPACSLDCSSQIWVWKSVCCCICRKGRDLHIGNREQLTWVWTEFLGLLFPDASLMCVKSKYKVGWIFFSQSALYYFFFHSASCLLNRYKCIVHMTEMEWSLVTFWACDWQTRSRVGKGSVLSAMRMPW